MIVVPKSLNQFSNPERETLLPLICTLVGDFTFMYFNLGIRHFHATSPATLISFSFVEHNY